MEKKVVVVGGGLAGCEAAYQLAKRKVKVDLYEMRPHDDAKAHHSDKLGELVCSNSLKSNDINKASGLLKEELKILDSLIIKAAHNSKVKAGQSLSVDREKFADFITKKITENKNINLINKEYKKIEKDKIIIIASGPLSSQKISSEIQNLIGEQDLYFYDASSPIIDANSIDYNIAYFKSRYDKGGKDYLNLPLNKEKFLNFHTNLIEAKRYPLKKFEKEIYFHSCMPIEVIGRKNYKSLLFGPMKPVGLENGGEKNFAVVQLRKEDEKGNMYNMVGFQTNLLQKEQKRVFSLIPGLENAKFLRYGMMHKNSYINAFKHLNKSLSFKKRENIFFAGQLIGVEGYVESSMSGLLAGLNAYKLLINEPLVNFPDKTMSGSILKFVCENNKKYPQPMNANFGVFIGEKEKVEISLDILKRWVLENEL